MYSTTCIRKIKAQIVNRTPYPPDSASADEIRGDASLARGQGHTGGAPGLKTAEHIGHVLPQRAHYLESLKVLPDLIRRVAMDHVPILRGDDGHLGYHEIFIELVERDGRSGAARGGDGGGRLHEEHFARGGIEHPVHKGRHRAVCGGEVHRAAENEAVRRGGAVNEVIDAVVNEAPAAVIAPAAAETAGYRLSADVEHLRFYPLTFKRGGDLGKRRGGAAVPVRASVHKYDFHISISLLYPRLTRTHTVLTGRKTSIRPQRPWEYTKYSLRPFRRLTAFLPRQNCLHLTAMDFRVIFGF